MSDKPMDDKDLSGREPKLREPPDKSWIRFESRGITGLGRRRCVDSHDQEHCPSCDSIYSNPPQFGGPSCLDKWHRRYGVAFEY